MKVLVVRHGLAESSAVGERALTEEGRTQFQTICQRLESLKLSFDLLLHSPLLRARQTADIFCDFFPVKKHEKTDHLKPDADVQFFFEALSAVPAKSLVLVGHQPFLSYFISVSLAENRQSFISLERGGMAFLEFSNPPVPGSAILTALLNPRILLGE